MRIRIRRGEALLASVIKGFDGMLEDLAVAGEQIKTKREYQKSALIDAQMRFQAFERQSKMQDELLEAAQARAEAVRQNIAKLVGA